MYKDDLLMYIEDCDDIDELNYIKNKLDKNSNRVNELWDYNYNELVEFINTYNRYPKQTVKEEKRLSIWCSQQRTIFNKGELIGDYTIKYHGYILNLYRINKLKEIGFNFSKATIIKKDKWNDRFNELKEFININGRLPKKSIDSEKSLYNFILTSRCVYNNGKLDSDGKIRYNRSYLDQDRIDKLESIHVLVKRR